LPNVWLKGCKPVKIILNPKQKLVMERKPPYYVIVKINGIKLSWHFNFNIPSILFPLSTHGSKTVAP
jgi:hypothetical protein